MAVHSVKSSRTALLLLAALLLIFLAAAPFQPSALAEETQTNAGTKTSNTTLIVYADHEQNKLLALFLVADSPDEGLLSVLSIPVNSRTVVNSGLAHYAPIRTAYAQEGNSDSKIARLAESVQILLGGAPLDRVIAVSPENVREILDESGGMRVDVSDLPPTAIVQSPGESHTYPADSNNDALATWLKRSLSVQGKNADYDIDVAKSIADLNPNMLSNPDTTSLVLSGDQAVIFLGFTIFPNNTGTDILQVRRLQKAFEWILQSTKENGGRTCMDPSELLYHDGGQHLMERLCGYDSAIISGSMVFPSGIDRVFAGENHWVFDTVWLHDWIMEYIYLK